MNSPSTVQDTRFGADDLRLPEDIREPLLAHLRGLKKKYEQRHWAGRVGFGQRPAQIVIDMAKFWLDSNNHMGSQLDPVLESCRRVLDASRAAGIPIFFTTFAYDPATPPAPHDKKLRMQIPAICSISIHVWIADRRKRLSINHMHRPSKGPIFTNRWPTSGPILSS